MPLPLPRPAARAATLGALLAATAACGHPGATKAAPGDSPGAVGGAADLPAGPPYVAQQVTVAFANTGAGPGYNKVVSIANDGQARYAPPASVQPPPAADPPLVAVVGATDLVLLKQAVVEGNLLAAAASYPCVAAGCAGTHLAVSVDAAAATVDVGGDVRDLPFAIQRVLNILERLRETLPWAPPAG